MNRSHVGGSFDAESRQGRDQLQGVEDVPQLSHGTGQREIDQHGEEELCHDKAFGSI